MTVHLSNFQMIQSKLSFLLYCQISIKPTPQLPDLAYKSPTVILDENEVVTTP